MKPSRAAYIILGALVAGAALAPIQMPAFLLVPALLALVLALAFDANDN